VITIGFERWEGSLAMITELPPDQLDRAEPPEGGGDHPHDSKGWRASLAAYAAPSRRRSFTDLISSVVPYIGATVGMYFAIAISPFLALALAPLVAAFLLRTYIVFHDCSHGSFLASRRGNLWVGTVCGLLVLSPFVRWRHDHAVHHATSGDLDRRGVGDLPTLTVAEYNERSWRGRLAYRMIRHPAVLFGIGPVFAMIVGPRIVARNARPRMRNSVIWTDVALAIIAASLIWLIGIGDFLLIWAPAAMISGAVGIWLFYVQHQFEDAYWQHSERWSYASAALRGSSFLRLPQPLQFMTGNIGYHHIHHLSSRIPNYNLQRAHEGNPVFQSVPTLSLWDGLRAVRLKLWDEQRGRLVTFAQARARPA
jgi:omega-6 fatty acid desaturase (delta-12 desaturase)